MGNGQSGESISIYDITVKDGRGRDVSMANYKGKVLLIVNVASKCGLVDVHYTQLAELHSKYKNDGLEILAFPCSQFMNQEPGTEKEIEQFACTRFKAEFPIFQKVCVNGPDTAPIYRFLKESKRGIGGTRVKWNFTKFLVARDGTVIQRFSLTTMPLAIESNIKELLAQDPQKKKKK